MKKLSSFIVAVLMLGAPAAEAANTFRIGTGVDYSSGGASGLVRSAEINGSYETGPWTFKAIVPYLSVRDAGNTETGLGDIIAGVTYNVLAGKDSAPRLDLTGKVKFGTADDNKNLGTGKDSYSLQADLAKNIGKFTALGMVGYRWNTDTNTTNFKDVIFGSVGGSYKFTAKTNGGLIYSTLEASTTGVSMEQEITAFVGRKFTKGKRLQFYVMTGLSNNSPDIGFGTSISKSF